MGMLGQCMVQKNDVKDKVITILLFMSFFHNFAHKLKTS